MAALTHQGCDRKVQRRLSRCRADRADAAFQRRKPFLENRDRRVGNPRVDVAGPLQIEQRGRMIGIGKDEGGGLINRYRTRAGCRIRLLASAAEASSSAAEGDPATRAWTVPAAAGWRRE